MPQNLFWTIRIPNSYSYGWSINVLAKFYNSTCLTIPTLMWKGTKGQSMITFFFFHKMHKPLKVTWSSSKPHIHDPMFWRCALFDPTLNTLDVSMIAVLHPTHSPMPLHTQMIVGNFPQSLQTHQHWCFHPPLSIRFVHSNLEM